MNDKDRDDQNDLLFYFQNMEKQEDQWLNHKRISMSCYFAIYFYPCLYNFFSGEQKTSKKTG